MKRRRSAHLAMHILAGAAAGFFASWTMNQFQSAWSKISQSQSGDDQNQDKPESDEDTTMKAANRLAMAVAGHELTKEQKKLAGPVLHYAIGTAAGAVYGALAAESDLFTTGFGTAFGTAVFIFGDEIAVPAFKLSGPPTAYPVSSHMYAWLSHLVYGVSLETARRGTESLMTLRKPRRRLFRAA